MDFWVNELSFRERFRSSGAFRESLRDLMLIRNALKDREVPLYCHHSLLAGEEGRGMVGHLRREEKGALFSWLSAARRDWSDMRRHGDDDYFELGDGGEVITDTALAEAAWRCLSGMDCSVVSNSQSQEWMRTPIHVNFHENGLPAKSAEIRNFWERNTVIGCLDALPERGTIGSWQDLETYAAGQFTELLMPPDCFASLAGLPFSRSAADRVCFLLGVLDKYKRCFAGDGKRTAEGGRIYRDYFEQGSIFSDSSEQEKNRFRDQLTFKHPTKHGEGIFCPWHGKLHQLQLRIHFSWPIRPDEPLYVMYVGRKRTLR